MGSRQLAAALRKSGSRLGVPSTLPDEPRIEVTRNRGGSFYFVLRAPGFEVLMTSCHFATQDMAWDGAERVKQIMADAKVMRPDYY